MAADGNRRGTGPVQGGRWRRIALAALVAAATVTVLRLVEGALG